VPFHLSPELRCVFPQQSFSDDDGFCFSDQPERIARYRYDIGNGTKADCRHCPYMDASHKS